MKPSSKSSQARLSPRVVLALAFCAAWLLPCIANAQSSKVPREAGYNYGEVETPRAAGVAGAIRATAIGTSAILSNPANMAAAKVYHITALAQIYPETGRQTYGGAVVDSLISSSGLAGGFYGAWNQQDPDGMRREWIDMRFGMAMPLGDILFLGATGRYFSLTENGLGPLGYSKASGGIPKGTILETFTFDAGATIRPVPELSLSIVGHNLTDQNNSYLPLMGALAMGFATEDFSLSGDVVLDSRTWEEAKIRVQGGGEVLIANRVPLRGGYRYDQGLNSHAIAMGAGYLDQKFGIDVAFRRGVSGPEYSAITFGFTLHIESMGLGPN